MAEEPGPDCSALLDEELSSFVFSYLTDSQCLLMRIGEISIPEVNRAPFVLCYCRGSLIDAGKGKWYIQQKSMKRLNL